MKSNIFALALAASASLCLSACGTAGQLPIPLDQLTAAANTAVPTIKLIAAQDGADPATVDAIGDFATGVQEALQTYVDTSAACTGVDRVTCFLTASSKVATLADTLVANPSIAKIIGATAGPKVADAVKALHTAILAAQDAKAASTEADPTQKLVDVNAALLQLNFAVLQAVQAAR